MSQGTESVTNQTPISKQLRDMFLLLKPHRLQYVFALFLRLMANVFYTALVLIIIGWCVSDG